ncbi:asparagine synthase (glutamine-hydrolyzing) [Streptomyces sp. NPDC126514]|uniref:asparagine synthase (glutamine-hydrolyzing) n=1 Tax=Streptomyces sp. NPDC126514 TaxID=3155210 RepID=UPI00332D05F8
MCGIAGIVDFHPPSNGRGELITSMTDALTQRGPDEGRVWVGKSASLGTRRLSVIDVAGGSQPIVHQHGDQPPVALAYTGEVFNHRELRAELAGRGHDFATDSDTEVVLHAYLEWGTACAERLLGMFAFAVWDGRSEELVLIRDRFGIYPMYYAEVPGGLAFGSEIKALLEHPCIAPEVGLDGLRAVIGFVKLPQSGIYRDVQEMMPGTLLRMNRTGISVHRYWSLTPKEHTDDLDTTIATVRELLEDSVRRQMVSDVPVGLFLSGGLDSSALTALAAQSPSAALDGKLRTFAVGFGGSQEFRADDIRTTPDAPFVQRMVDHLGTVHTTVEVTGRELMDPQARAAVLRARDMPTPLGDLDTSLYLLCKAFRQDCTVALTGDGADELFGGYDWFLDPAFRKVQGLPWLEYARQKLGAPGQQYTGLLDPDFVRQLELDQYEQDVYSTTVAGIETLDGESETDQDIRRMTYLNLTGYLRIILDRKDRMGMATALESRVPFLDHRLVEYVYNVPWSIKSFDGREKSLLRAAVRDLLPPSVLYRKKAGYPPTQDPAYAAGLRAELARILADRQAPVHTLLSPNAVRAFIEGGSGASRINRAGAELVVQLDLWLRNYQVHLLT